MIEIRDAWVGTGEGAVLRGVSCTVAPGELVGLIGLNGSGKSTLGRLMSAAQLPSSGSVKVEGLDATQPDARAAIRATVGRVGQNPADQLISTIVRDEVAFGARNLGCDDTTVDQRVERALHSVGLDGFEAREVNGLSGGEQQRVAIASALAMEPRYLVLDEVTSQLDSGARADMRALIRSLARSGIGVVLITHDPLEAAMCDRLMVLEAGAIAWEGESAVLLRADDGLWDRTLPPSPYIDALRLLCAAGYPLEQGCEPAVCASWARAAVARGDVAAGALQALLGHPAPFDDDDDARDPASRALALAFDSVAYAYGDEDALRACSLAVPAGSLMLVAGPSGAGKTTLASLAAGVIEPQEGTVLVQGEAPRPGRVGLSFQNPEQQLFLESVERELSFAPRNAGCADDEVAARVRQAAERLEIADLLPRDPFALSGGQARRVAIGSVLTLDAPVLVLDEPTAGLDAPGRAALHAVLREETHRGVSVLVVSHDLEEWLPLVDEVALLNAGGIVWCGRPGALYDDPAIFGRAGLAAPASLQLLQGLDAARAQAPDRAKGRGQASMRRRKPSGASPHGQPVPRVPERRAPRSGAVSAFGSYIVADTPLARIDVRVKLVLLLIATAALFASGALAPMIAWLALVGCVMASARVPAAAVIRTLRPAMLLFAFIVCANLVSCDGSAQVVLAGPIGLSITGAERAAAVVARIVMLVCLALCVTASTTPTQLADACVRLLRPFARLGVPVGDLGIVLTMALRFIPLVAEEVERVRRSQAARGVAFDEGGLVERIRAWGAVLVPVVVGLFRRADRIAESMDARCFSQAGAALPSRRPLGTGDWMVLLGGAALMGALVAFSHMMG